MAPASEGPVLGMENVSVHFRQKTGTVRAVEDVSLSVGKGEIVGLVGESGSGKSTLARCAVRLLKPTAGTVRILGDDVTHLSQRGMRPLRRRAHMVFQDSYSAMNPRMKIGDVVAEPLRQHRVGNRQDRRDRVVEMLTRVGLRADHATRSPHELSGGQRQRIGIARALILSPELLVADEPVSALDVSIQAAILNLLVDLQRELGFSCLFITHDLSVVEHVSNRIAVMYLGRVVEQGTREQLFARPEHPYTQALMSAAPYPDPVRQRSRQPVVLAGDVPSPLNPPVGCGFHSRCPLAI
ncbi:ABC transporter ATP-binding protein, partial [Phytoactinopolyspora endophytica]|uniref:ABC transporter ATP-binding protein n=1 Tax=Phytoactinopolyspora endophytica TaxID=1642495 RepID=UPI0013EDD082